MASSNTLASTPILWDVQPLVDLLPEWTAKKDRLHGSTTQHIAWVSQWQAEVNPDCFCVVGRIDQHLDFVLTLEVIRQGPLKIAIFPGGRHANENFPCVSIGFSSVNETKNIEVIKKLIRQKRPDIDAVYLHRQVKKTAGLTNPVLPISRSTETDIALSFELNSDFQVILDARDGSKKQKRIRKTARRLDERGGWTYEIVANDEEAKNALTRFFELKAHRLAGKGIVNVFAAQEVQAFFKSIFAQSVEQSAHEFEMHVLKVGGDIAAVTGNSRLSERLNVEFTAVDDTDSSISHGEFLYFQMISNACSRGIKTFSFGVGDEPFKRSWCDVETPQYNTTIALTLKGSIAASVDGLKTKAKRMVKSNKRLYGFLKNLRKTTKKSPTS
jgi:CelD/BcsL family acetyltransferase involved in cellulose biosynthesis